MGNLFGGIDPGQTGGLALLDSNRQFVAAWRWDPKEPRSLYDYLLKYREVIEVVYLEEVRTFPREEKGLITVNQSLLVNAGIWEGFLIALQVPYLKVPMTTWQAAQGLFQWRKKQLKNIRQHSPLSLARAWWPGAPLDFQADDGKAAALLLADLAARDSAVGFDRAASQEFKAQKVKAKKKAARRYGRFLKWLNRERRKTPGLLALASLRTSIFPWPSRMILTPPSL
jgi:hypothetical protein